jgi:hypothetical protein
MCPAVQKVQAEGYKRLPKSPELPKIADIENQNRTTDERG